MMGRTAAVPVRSVGRVAVGASRMTVARAPSVAGGRPAARSMRLIGDDDRARSVVARAADDESMRSWAALTLPASTDSLPPMPLRVTPVAAALPMAVSFRCSSLIFVSFSLSAF